MSDYGHVAVLMGGWSSERSVSLQSGQCVMEALAALDIQATAVDLQREALAQLGDQGYDRCFMALHGPGGEDGEVQTVLEQIGLPYTGSGVAASKLCMDKWATKQCWAQAGLPSARALQVEMKRLDAQVKELGLPLVVKPNDQGSSVGVTMVDRIDQLCPAVETARKLSEDVLLERRVLGREYTIGVLQDEAMPMVGMKAAGDFYDFRAKYEADDTHYDIPCGLPTAMESELQSQALRAFDVTGAEGYGRVDLILDELDRPWFLELNTAPGLRDHSLLPMAAAAVGIEYDTLILKMLETSRTQELSQ